MYSLTLYTSTPYKIPAFQGSLYKPPATADNQNKQCRKITRHSTGLLIFPAGI